MMYEDAKLSRKHMNTAYSDFKGAFGGMDHRILFNTITKLDFPECDTQTYEQLYRVFGTYYMTPHGHTSTIPTHRSTLQGDTLSPFLFTISMEPLLRWLSIGSRGYKTMQ